MALPQRRMNTGPEGLSEQDEEDLSERAGCGLSQQFSHPQQELNQLEYLLQQDLNIISERRGKGRDLAQLL